MERVGSFAGENISNTSFLPKNLSLHVSRELHMRPAKFLHRLAVWWNHDFVEVRGKSKLSINLRQLIVDVYLENSIPSVDCIEMAGK